MKNLRRNLKWSFLVLLILLFVRVFLFQIVTESSFHMASTLLPGDRVIINKFRAGWRLPITPVGLPGTNAPYIDVRLPYLRLPAIKKLKRQDVIAFNTPAGSDSPIDRKKLMISRIVGLPTDTVLIKDKVVTVNNKLVAPPASSRIEYRITNSGQPIPNDFLRKYDLEAPRVIAEIGIFDLDLPKEAAAELEKMEGIKTVRETKHFLGDGLGEFYPISNFFMWNRDQFGPFRVPAKGMEVGIDLRSIDFYREMIETHEGHDVLVDFSGVHIDGKLVNTYTFAKNYYFVLSDSRDNPNDSRKIGFVPEDHILGIASRIIWSSQNQFSYFKKLHPGRILKGIR